jgi:glycogen debranching enzyme
MCCSACWSELPCTDAAAYVRLPSVQSSNTLLDRIAERSVLDLRVLLAEMGRGPVPVAGIPWFAVPFGRDSLLTALEALPFSPELAAGTLRTLAALQGTEHSALRQEEPGKIPHELRCGEMANLDEVRFKRYYGTVDATALFLVLLCEYCAWTGDLALVRDLLPNVRAALAWIDSHGEAILSARLAAEAYHNGSVWPHDTALCVLGLKRSCFDREAAAHFAYFRLPELFCGHACPRGSAGLPSGASRWATPRWISRRRTAASGQRCSEGGCGSSWGNRPSKDEKVNAT